jgi:glycosyltransferase involved in cell wall biosynthesis
VNLVSACRRVALYNGVFVRHDAISDSLRHKLEIVTALADAGVPVAPVVFTHYSDSSDPAVFGGRGTFDVVTSPRFWDADLHWYEFGIAYDLFDTVFARPPERPALGIYHNVTPLDLVTDPESRQAVERSMVQRHNFALFDHVACVSALNRDDLLALGLAPDRLSVLHLPPAVTPGGATRLLQSQRNAGEPVRLLFVGRFVRSKGLVDLVEAAALLLQRGVDHFELTLVGSPEFADAPTRQELHRLRQHHGLSQHVTVAGRVEHDELAALYRSADSVVLPSYHEGYCVPVIEAMGQGCYVIASSAGNLPVIVGGLGTLVTAGDVGALADAMQRFVAETMAGYSLAAYRRGVLDLLDRFLPGLSDHPAWDAAVASLVASGAPLGVS